MYTTFVGFSADQQHQNSNPSSTAANRPQKAKRHQVSRACGPCRASRARCSQHRPCKTCTDRRISCTDTSHSGSSGPSAVEVVELRTKIQQLEKRLEDKAADDSGILTPPGTNSHTNGSTPPARTSRSQSSANSDSHEASITTTENTGASALSRPKEIHSHDATPAGPLFSRTSVFQRSPFSGNIPHDDDKAQEDAVAAATPCDQRLSKSAQLFQLGNFWLHLHYLIPVLCEREVNAHFEALWPSAPGTPSISQMRRRPSPLIDIIIACAIQHANASQLTASRGHGTCEIQKGYFESSQSFIVADAIDSPRLVHVQTLVLLSHYLAREGKIQKASSYSAMALRMSMDLDLHREPPSNLDTSTQELRRRIWWSVYTAEAVRAVAYGHQWMLDDTLPTVGMMADDFATMAVTCPQGGRDEGSDTTWLSHSVQMASLYQIAVTGLCKRKNENRDQGELIARLERWAKQVPKNLRTAGIPGRGNREGSGAVASGRDGAREEEETEGEADHTFDETPFADPVGTYRLQIDASKPQWLQKQRLLLELHFRQITMLFCHTSIEQQLEGQNTNDGPVHMAIKCFNHALSMSRILPQVLTETPLLDSRSEALQMLWNASMALVAFLVAYGSRAPKQNIVETLRHNCELFGHFASQTGAAGRARFHLQQLLQRMAIDSPLNAQLQLLPTALTESNRSPFPIVTTLPNHQLSDSFPIQQDGVSQGLPATAGDAVSSAGPANWPAHFGQLPSLGGTNSSGVPSSVASSWGAWPPYMPSSASSAMFPRGGSYMPWGSDTGEDVQMDDLMLDWSAMPNAVQQPFGRVA